MDGQSSSVYTMDFLKLFFSFPLPNIMFGKTRVAQNPQLTYMCYK